MVECQWVERFKHNLESGMTDFMWGVTVAAVPLCAIFGYTMGQIERIHRQRIKEVFDAWQESHERTMAAWKASIEERKATEAVAAAQGPVSEVPPVVMVLLRRISGKGPFKAPEAAPKRAN